MEWLISYKPPVPRKDLKVLQEELRNADPFVPSFSPEANDPYDVITYLQKQMVRRQQICLLVDRNVVTRWIGLMEDAPATPSHRTAAAILAFAQAAELLIEPSIAFHELAASAGNRVARHELSVFYRANDVDPGLWTQVALGRTDRLKAPPTISSAA